jgi:hypothetical protein
MAKNASFVWQWIITLVFKKKAFPSENSDPQAPRLYRFDGSDLLELTPGGPGGSIVAKMRFKTVAELSLHIAFGTVDGHT